jgi:hypothetical protein
MKFVGHGQPVEKSSAAALDATHAGTERAPEPARLHASRMEAGGITRGRNRCVLQSMISRRIDP